MISIGNDIVDLAAIDKQRTQQKNFYAKILSATEQQLYNRPGMSKLPFETFVWLLWSAKESVYKFAKRLNPDLIFSPARIECLFESEFYNLEPKFSELKNDQNLILEDSEYNSHSLNSGQYSKADSKILIRFKAIHQSKSYCLQSLTTPGFIATIASDNSNFDHINWGIKHIEQSDYESQSDAVRIFMLKRINELFPGKDDFSIDKKPVGYPVILKDRNETNIKVSFAHHGNYVAYALGK